MAKVDSGVKFLFAGLVLVAGLILIALFWRPFYIKVMYLSPRPVTVEDVARDRLPEGALVSVQGIIDPRHAQISHVPGSDQRMEVRLLLADDSYMADWQDAIQRDTDLLKAHLEPALKKELVRKDMKEFMESVDNFDSRWNSRVTQLNKTIRDAWPGYAVGVARLCADCAEGGFDKRTHPERNWVLDGFHPPGGPQERPPWPEEIVVSNPIKRSEIPLLRGYLQGEVDYYEGSALQVAAELKAFQPEVAFGRLTTVVGTVRKMPKDAFESYEAIDDLLFDVYYYIKEGDQPSTIGLVFVPIGLMIDGLMVLLMLKWALFGRKRYDFDD